MSGDKDSLFQVLHYEKKKYNRELIFIYDYHAMYFMYKPNMVENIFSFFGSV